MQKSSIANNILQELLDSAANGGDKGQAQWFTPPDWAKVLSIPLCQYRPHVVDLTCGNGQLLAGASRRSKLLGCELQPDVEMVARVTHTTADITKLYPLLRAVGWKADVFALNPPWDMHWYRAAICRLTSGNADEDGVSNDQHQSETLADARSRFDCPAVADAFTGHDGRTSRDTIDSTVATLCIALDRMRYAARFTPSSSNAPIFPARDHWLSVPAASAEFHAGSPFPSPS
jgi:hypothetical protein